MPARIHGQALAGFQIAQLADFLKGKIDLRRVEGLEDDHVVPLLAQMRERHVHGRLVAEQIGDHHDQRAPPDRAGDFVQRFARCRCSEPGGCVCTCFSMLFRC